MWLTICQFEIWYKLRRPETYVFFVFLLLSSMFAFDFIYLDKEMGPLHSSSPQVIGTTMAVLSGFFMIITSMVMGVPVLKDYELKMESLLFVTPIQKWEYLLGRSMGSFVILLLVFSSIPLGMMLGDLMPWRAESTIPSNYLLNYLHTYVVVLLPAMFFGGSIFFVTGMLSRKMIVVYTQGLVFFLILLISVKIENPIISGILDPFSHMAIGQVMDEFSTQEAAAQLIPLQGIFLFNRLFWVGIGVGTLVYGYFRFTFEIASSRKKQQVSVAENLPNAAKPTAAIATFTLTQHGLRTSALQLQAHSLFYFSTVLRKPAFWAIIICGIVTILVNSVNLRATYGVSSLPVTYLILDELKEMAIFFFLIMLGLFASEVIWRERRHGIDQVVDALPVSDLVMVGGKFLGLVATYIVLLVCLLLFGVSVQAVNGFYDFQFSTYFVGLGELWVLLVLYTFVSFFFQVISNSQFIGHVLLVVFFIGSGLLALKGFNHGLYDFGGPGLSDYSELNGFGDSFYPFVLFKSYWLAFCFGLLAITSALIPRGKEVSLNARIKGLSQRLTPEVKGVAGFASLSVLLLGAFIFYNTNVLRPYHSASSKLDMRADYEKTLKHFEYIPQPKITDVSLSLKLFPAARGYQLEGTYVLKNMDSVDMESIHVQTFTEGSDAMSQVTFDREANPTETYEQLGYTIYELDHPLVPGDSVEMRFTEVRTSQGFSPNDESSEVIYNGTFINNNKFPSLGYCSQIQIEDHCTRKDYGLDSLVQKANRDHPFETFYGRDGGDGSAVGFDIVISTSVDQIAVAPGVLVKEWVEENRHYFQYRVARPMINFYAVTSARYEVERSQWASPQSSTDPVELEVYHHPSHDRNVRRMMDGLSAGLSYCSDAFGPYPYATLKIAEVPRDFDRAQSFPTLIAYSESMGFIMAIDSLVDLNLPFFITAHEVAHQWWGMQLVAANVKGKYLLLESLSHFSAIMTYQKTYGEEEAQRLVEFEKVGYLAGSRKDGNLDVPLVDVTDQEYLYYSKAAIALYELQANMGEAQLNAALRSFMEDWNATARIAQGKRFATSVDLLPYIRANAPEDLQPRITELFEEVCPVEPPVRGKHKS